jgi:hypothetical protein
VVVTVLICYLVLGYAVNMDDINGIVSPLIFVGILSYYVSLMFSEIFSMSIETILCCYIADEEMFAPAERFADGALKTTLQKTAQAASNKKVGNVSYLDDKKFVVDLNAFEKSGMQQEDDVIDPFQKSSTSANHNESGQVVPQTTGIL